MTDNPRPKLSGGPLSARLARVRLLSLDCDGVLTDGGIYVAEDGGQLRKFNVKDGMGMQRVRQAGVEVALITASDTQAIAHRGQSLGLRHVFVGVTDKKATLDELRRSLKLDWEAVAHVGDDLNDLPLLALVGVPMTVADAMPAARDAAVYVTRNRGGAGAVREICDLLVAARRPGS